MPVYEYQCQACRRDFEYQQRMSDPEKTTCEACGGALDRLISRTAFALKGSGWYKDLYASPKPATTDAKAEAKTDGKPAADAKPDAKVADKPAAAATVEKAAPKPSGSGGSSGSNGGGASGGTSGSTTGGSSGSVAKAS